jgi:hypothetical protein
MGANRIANTSETYWPVNYASSAPHDFTCLVDRSPAPGHCLGAGVMTTTIIQGRSTDYNDKMQFSGGPITTSLSYSIFDTETTRYLMRSDGHGGDGSIRGHATSFL